MNRNRPSRKTDQLLRVAAIVLVVVIAGPEIGISLEVFAFLDVVGGGLFFFCFVVGFRSYLAWVFRQTRTLLEKIDPYFFVPSHQQIPKLLERSLTANSQRTHALE
jgi:hypothetical protein